MALALGLIIFVPLTVAFNAAVKTWDEHIAMEELYQHGRVAMERITSELRYATHLVDKEDSGKLKFYTRNLIDKNWDPEVIWYETQQIPSYWFDGLARKQEGDPFYFIAGGEVSPGIKINLFIYEVHKVSGGLFVPLGDSEPISAADVVKVRLDLATEDDKYWLTLTSRVQLRNK